nr:hypothetical protein [Streptomyces sp. NRRL S-378]
MTATPLGRPVEPEVYITYASCPGRHSAPGSVTGIPADCGSSSTSRTVGADGRPRPRIPVSVSNTGAEVSSTIHCIRSIGNAACSGT